MLPVQFSYTILALCCLYAFAKGGPPERIGAAIYFVSNALTAAALSAPPHRYVSVELRALVVDAGMLVALTLLTVKAERFWPLWVTALQAIGTAGHALRVADPELLRVGYAFALAFWSYPMLALLAAGTYCHRRRLRLHGADESWSSSFTRSATTRASGPTA